MGLAALILFLILFGIVASKLSKYCYRVSAESEARKEEERFYKEALLSSVQNIERHTAPETPAEPDPVEGLLRANQELIEKRAVKKAIESELGIPMQ